MKNLAGRSDCNESIEHELTKCRIEIIRNQPQEGEVPSSLRGKLGNFVFFRAWRYWIARGNVPLEVAKELYDDPVGKEDVRVQGHCGCPAPVEPWIIWLDKDGYRLLPISYRAKLVREHGEGSTLVKLLDESDFRLVDSLESEGKPFIPVYHIDTEVGLRLFADTLKKHGLA